MVKIPVGTKVWGRKGTLYEKVCGVTTGSVRRCQLESCGGTGVYVKWPDGKITIPCSNGLVSSKDGLRIT